MFKLRPTHRGLRDSAVKTKAVDSRISRKVEGACFMCRLLIALFVLYNSCALFASVDSGSAPRSLSPSLSVIRDPFDGFRHSLQAPQCSEVSPIRGRDRHSSAKPSIKECQRSCSSHTCLKKTL